MAHFFYLSLPSSFCLSLSLSRLSWSKKAPRPFLFFFFDFFPSFGRDHGSSGKRQSSPATGSKKKKNQDDSFFGLVFQSAFVSSSSTNPLVFGLCAEKFHRDEKKTTYSHTRYNSKKNVFRSFLLCWHQSRRQDERPRLFLLEKSLLVQVFAKENYGGFAMFFF